jgi:zinc transport system substrate-binding protein
MTRTKMHSTVALSILLCLSTGCQKSAIDREKNRTNIVTSDAILSGMVISLLPPGSFNVSAIMPPDQCPGHYDIKLSDIERVKKAGLVISFQGMPFMAKAEAETGNHYAVAAKDRNWMAPRSYVFGLDLIAKELSVRFPGHKTQITTRLAAAINEVKEKSDLLGDEIKKAGISGAPVIASSMQKETLEWMGFRIVGEYGRPEAISAKEMVRLSQLGKENKVIAIVDNLQSGPEAGKGLAEELHVPHVILSNFPSERGYVATLGENVKAMIAAVRTK